jgi:hypothetical protein
VRWAVTALQTADYYELDCSFKALKLYLYAIPLAVKGNVGIPLGVVIAPTESWMTFWRENLFELSLLSDEGRAVRSYSDGNAENSGHHRYHSVCDRYLLESLRYGTSVALFARRLLFTNTEQAFTDELHQILSDCAMAYQRKLVKPSTIERFAKMLGLNVRENWDAEKVPEVDQRVFVQQAMWGERGFTFRVTQNAGRWSYKVTKGWCLARNKMETIAGSNGFHHSTCPQPAICGQEAVMSRRLGLHVSCVHEVLDKGWSVQNGPRQFDLCNTGHRDIIAQEFSGQ